MSRYRKIDPRIWNDAKFRVMSDEAKLVLFLLLTHPNMTALGAMRATLPGLAAELGWEAKDFREAFDEAALQGIVEHDEEACFVGLPRFLRYNSPESPNVVKAWVGAMDLLPECVLKSVVLQRAQVYAEAMSEGFAEAFRKAFAKAMANQEQEQEQEQNKSESPKGDLATATGVAIDAEPNEPAGASSNCPHEEIIAAYHEILPSLRRVRQWTPERSRMLRARWREDVKRQNLEWWRKLFEYVQTSDFLMGRTQASRDGKVFEADLEWIVRPRNFVKITEGKYENSQAVQA